jgi:hypothetical protein
MSVLINDDPIIGREFGTAAIFRRSAIRHIDGSGSRALPNYRCNGEVHYCGEVLADVAWNIRNNMNTRYGAPDGPGPDARPDHRLVGHHDGRRVPQRRTRHCQARRRRC